MARSHLRYSVTDHAGNVVQNASVNVYQRGTTTPVTNMWTAASGGSASPNPLITNNQGEIEGWLDVAQSVTLRITDNTDAAYYPSTPGSLLSWTPFSEDIEVLPAPEDIGAPHAHPYEASGSVETHRLDTTSVHGIADTALLETQAGSQSKVDAEAVLRADADALLIPLSQKGAPNGVPTLDAGSLVPTAQLPPLSISETFTVASQAAMLALTAQRGDVAIRTDLSRAFILSTDSPGTLADWKELLTPADAVTSVDGRTGVVALGDLYAPFAHSAADTGVHGVGASTVESVAGSTAKVAAHNLLTNVHGIADTAQIALKNAANTFSPTQTFSNGIATQYLQEPASTSGSYIDFTVSAPTGVKIVQRNAGDVGLITRLAAAATGSARKTLNSAAGVVEELTAGGFLGLGAAPAYKLDVRGANDTTQIHFSDVDADSGGYMSSESALNASFSAAVAQVAGTWRKKDAGLGTVLLFEAGSWQHYSAAGAVGAAAAFTLLSTVTAAGQLQLPIQGSAGGVLIGGDWAGYRSAAGVATLDLIAWKAANEQTTVGLAGLAAAPPLTPTKWLKVKDSAGTTLVIPAYAA